jgi:hypothetical protein
MIKPMNPKDALTDGCLANGPPPDPAALAADLGRSLQLSRASALALTRLQLAMKSRDRQAAMAALDRLHTLDAEMERLADHLPAPAADDPGRAEWDAIVRHLGDQKLALAFEKLAVASEISGPDLVSARGPQHSHPPARTEQWPARRATGQAPTEQNDPPPLAEWPRLRTSQAGWDALPAWVLGLLAAVLALFALVAAVVATSRGWA